jgi:hypothetical protein
MFANHGGEDEIQPLTTIEIAKAHRKIKIEDLLQTNEKNRKDMHFTKCYAKMTN